MSIRELPLQPNQAHFTFRANLDDFNVRVRCNWLERFGYFSVDISVDGQPVVSGIGLHPNVNLLEGTDIGGELFIEGAQPTVANIGQNAKLKYREPK